MSSHSPSPSVPPTVPSPAVGGTSPSPPPAAVAAQPMSLPPSPAPPSIPSPAVRSPSPSANVPTLQPPTGAVLSVPELLAAPAVDLSSVTAAAAAVSPLVAPLPSFRGPSELPSVPPSCQAPSPQRKARSASRQQSQPLPPQRETTSSKLRLEAAKKQQSVEKQTAPVKVGRASPTRRPVQSAPPPLETMTVYQAHRARLANRDAQRRKSPPSQRPASSLPSSSLRSPMLCPSDADRLYQDPNFLFRQASTGCDLGCIRRVRAVDPQLIKGFIRCRDYSGRTLIHVAAWYGRVDVLQILLDSEPLPVRVDWRSLLTTRGKNSVLHAAAEGGRPHVIQWLRSRFAPAMELLIVTPNEQGLLPCDVAQQCGFTSIAGMLMA